MSNLAENLPLQFRPASLDAGIASCDAREGLDIITRPDAELVVWRRSLPPCLKMWLEQLDVSMLPDIRILVPPEGFRQALTPLLDDCGMSREDMRDMLVDDIHSLVMAFARITRTDLVDVRLERVLHDACWKFHRDCVEARLLTTYRGPATEWVHPRYAMQAIREQKQFDGQLEQLRIHDVAIFKGSCAEPASGIVHRSPPIAGSGAVRLLLCLNTPSETSPEQWSGTPSGMVSTP